MKTESKKLFSLKEGFGINGATLNLRLSHLYFFKESLDRVNFAIKRNDGEAALVALEVLKPFLELFSEIEHPYDVDIWKDKVEV